MNVHARARPVVMRLGHEGRFHAVRPGGGLDGALQQKTIERGGGGVLLVLQVDLELAGAGLLHDGVDGKPWPSAMR